MGLTNSATGAKAIDSTLEIKRQLPEDRVIAIAGNPNVGKSTVFNGLTGLNQHTGNWPGKTVSNAQGYCHSSQYGYVLVDIPGTYSLMAHSLEEEVARNYICFGEPDAVVVVCDATCLERNLNLVLQTIEISNHVIVCVNLMDEAKRKGITINLQALSERLGVPVVGTVARKKRSLAELLRRLDALMKDELTKKPVRIQYSEPIEAAVAIVEPVLQHKLCGKLNSRWLSLKLLDHDPSLLREVEAYLDKNPLEDVEVLAALQEADALLMEKGIHPEQRKDEIVSGLVLTAEEISRDTVSYEKQGYNAFDRKMDRLLTSKSTGYPIMLLLLAFIFWLTITGANYPSALLADILFWVQDQLTALFTYLHAPEWLHNVLVLGVYRVVAWVVSVMLPPMAIFFPLFTLLEDAGYLPRIAYNLDKPFKRCCACGKQALTMWIGNLCYPRNRQKIFMAWRFFFPSDVFS